MSIAAALILALMAQSPPERLACTLGYDDGSGKTARVGITLGGPRRVSFEDAEHLLGDERGTISPNQRGWRVKTKSDSILLESRVGTPGHGARLKLERSGPDSFAGRYYVNQGMLSESVAYGASGPITCEVVA